MQAPAPSPASTELSFDDVPFRGIVEQSLAGTYVVLDERFMYANDTFASMFGYAREEFIGRHMVDCVTADSAAEVMQNYHRRIRGEVRSIHYTTRGVRKDGGIVHLELHASRVMCRGRPALAGVALDITDRVLQQQQMQASREQLRELTQHVNQARETERARLAREVHDVLGGMLTSAKMDLTRIVRRTAAPGQAELHHIATDLVALMQETIDTARAISNELRPTSLDLLGLDVALTQTVERFGARHGLGVSVACHGPVVVLADAVAMQVFRIVQEGLTNIGRHARARSVRLELSYGPAMLALRLMDDGCGIQDGARRPGAIGLFSMAERAREIGARLRVTRREEGGTQLLLEMPLPLPRPQTPADRGVGP